MNAETRSRPMPVSMEGAGSAESTPSWSRLNSMNTLFQISTNRTPSPSTSSVQQVIGPSSGARS